MSDVSLTKSQESDTIAIRTFTLGSTMPIEAFAVSHRGSKHQDRGMPNEDAAACYPGDGLFAAVDGISSFLFSAMASRITIDWLRKYCTGTPSPDAMGTAFAAAGEEMRQHPIRRRRGWREMGCCASVLWLAEESGAYEGVLGHAGDTSIHMFANHALERLTMADARGRYVTCWVGSAAETDPYVTRVSIPKDIWVLLLTDGATKRVPDLEGWMRLNAPIMRPQELAMALVALALARGESDDITVVALRT